MAIGGRKVTCDIRGCDSEYIETEFGIGFPGWVQVSGVKLNGAMNPMVCPEHVGAVMDFIDSMEVIK